MAQIRKAEEWGGGVRSEQSPEVRGRVQGSLGDSVRAELIRLLFG